jgi:single cache domain-containing protein
MLRGLVFAAVAALCLSAGTILAETQFATPEEAKALLERAIAAMKEDKAKAFEMFATGEGGFKDKDLYVWCANASDGIVTVHPTNKGKALQDIKGKQGAPFGETIMQNAAEGTIKETTYWWPRPGSDQAFEKTTYYTKVGGLRRRVLHGVSVASRFPATHTAK